MIAPFAVGFSTYVLTAGGHVDLFAESPLRADAVHPGCADRPTLASAGVLPVRVSWWAVSFPLAASAIAGLRFAAAEPSLVTEGIGVALLALATVVIGALLARTLVGLARGELRTLSS